MPYKDKSAAKASKAAYYQRNRERVLANAAAYALANCEKIRSDVKAWKGRNPEAVALQRYKATIARGGVQLIARCDAHVRAWEIHSARLYDAHVSAFRGWFAGLTGTQQYRWRYHNNIEFALNERMRRQLRKKSEAVPGLAELIRAALRSGGGSNKVESLLGYSIAQLRSHLEKQFKRGMSWDAFGKDGIHIDHILPRKCFDVSTIEGLQAYWSLSNLRPLAARDNLRKAAHVHFLI